MGLFQNFFIPSSWEEQRRQTEGDKWKKNDHWNLRIRLQCLKTTLFVNARQQEGQGRGFFTFSSMYYFITVPTPFPLGLVGSELAWLVRVYRPVDTEVKHVEASTSGTWTCSAGKIDRLCLWFSPPPPFPPTHQSHFTTPTPLMASTHTHTHRTRISFWGGSLSVSVQGQVFHKAPLSVVRGTGGVSVSQVTISSTYWS